MFLRAGAASEPAFSPARFARISVASVAPVGLLSGLKTCPGEISMNVAALIGGRKEVFSISEDTTVYDAARYLRDRQVRSVGVLDATGQLTGVVSHSDISNKVAAENKCPAWMRVSEIMSRGLVVVRPEMALDECLRLMEKHGVFHLLVVEEQERYLGMISVADLLQVIASDHKARADMFEAFVFPQR